MLVLQPLVFMFLAMIAGPGRLISLDGAVLNPCLLAGVLQLCLLAGVGQGGAVTDAAAVTEAARGPLLLDEG